LRTAYYMQKYNIFLWRLVGIIRLRRKRVKRRQFNSFLYVALFLYIVVKCSYFRSGWIGVNHTDSAKTGHYNFVWVVICPVYFNIACIFAFIWFILKEIYAFLQFFLWCVESIEFATKRCVLFCSEICFIVWFHFIFSPRHLPPETIVGRANCRRFCID